MVCERQQPVTAVVERFRFDIEKAGNHEYSCRSKDVMERSGTSEFEGTEAFYNTKTVKRYKTMLGSITTDETELGYLIGSEYLMVMKQSGYPAITIGKATSSLNHDFGREGRKNHDLCV